MMNCESLLLVRNILLILFCLLFILFLHKSIIKHTDDIERQIWSIELTLLSIIFACCFLDKIFLLFSRLDVSSEAIEEGKVSLVNWNLVFMLLISFIGSLAIYIGSIWLYKRVQNNP